MVGCSGNPTNARLHKVKQYGILPRKSRESLPNLNFLSALIPMPLTSFLLLSTALFALRSFFSSSAWIRREIVGLVLLSHKPTLAYFYRQSWSASDASWLTVFHRRLTWEPRMGSRRCLQFGSKCYSSANSLRPDHHPKAKLRRSHWLYQISLPP